jgi:penicillin-binding protein 1A
MLCGLSIAGAVAVSATVIGAYLYVKPGLPEAQTIREIPLQIPLRIYSRDGRLIEEIGERRRILVEYEELPQHVIEAFIAAEDRRFFEHPGIDYQGILRAAVRWAASGEISGGGSTLTQQLARDYFLTREQVLSRKIREAFLAYKIEQEFTKEEIFALFVNKMFFGQRAYGVAAAAQVYFNKTLDQINHAEAATLAGVLPAPTNYNPVRSPANAEMRRAYVLGRMRDLGFIDRETYDASMDFPLLSRLHGTANELSAPHVAEMVRREMVRRYGEGVYDSQGFRVVTTLDSRLQNSANYAVRNGLLAFTRRRGYRGPIARLSDEFDPAMLHATDFPEWPEAVRVSLDNYGNPGGLGVALVTAIDDETRTADIMLQSGQRSTLPWYTMSWASPYIDRETTGPAPEVVSDILAPGDIIYVMPITLGGYALAQLPEAQSAIVSLDPNDGAITSLVGGFDFSISKYNRATQAARQPGSSFKPFIYSAALEQGNTPATIVLDSHVVIRSSELEEDWRPQNYSGRVYGEQRMREALVRSMNLASVRLLLEKTGIGNAVRHIAPFGFGDSALPRNGSLALGGGNASPLDMVQAYAAFANGGYAVKPYIIDSIFDAEDRLLYRAEPQVVCRRCEPDEKQAGAGRPLEPLRDPAGAAAAVADIVADIHYLAESEQPGYFETHEQQREAELARMADVALTYQPDAGTSPELFENVTLAPRIISEQNAFLIQDMMRDVIRRGTGRRALVLGRKDLSGKTGTSNDRRDAWFAGFNRGMSSVVWVGYDDDRPLGPREEGSRTALPIWIDFARGALRGVPENQMPMPEGIVTVRISRTTGCPADSNTDFADVMFEAFRVGNVPECRVSETLADPFNFDNDPGAGELPEEAREEETLF